MPETNRPGPGDRCHLVGVAGVGMSAVAQALLDCGASVSGSDRLLDHGEDRPAAAVDATSAIITKAA